jgi:Na+/proline symporter
MIVILLGMGLAFAATLRSLPSGIGLGGALDIARDGGKLHAISLDLGSRYNLWSGLLGGFFLQLAYFGTDQSQVQRYLTAKSSKQSQLGLLLNGLLKIPMQLGILFVGVMVFAAYHFAPQPLLFNPVEARAAAESARGAELAQLERDYHKTWEIRRDRTLSWLSTELEPDRTMRKLDVEESSRELAALRERAVALAHEAAPASNGNDINYVFLRFVLEHLPVGIVGLVLAAVFCASMSASSAELNALATTTTVDFYKRFLRPGADDARIVRVSRLATVCWGAFAVGIAQFAGGFGTLVEAVNVLGSLFYGTILGIFLTGFFLKRVGGTAVCLAALASEGLVVGLHFGTQLSFLWFNAIGCLAVLALSALSLLAQRYKVSLAPSK